MPKKPVNAGSLKLLATDVEKFKKALNAYGYESSAAFLRRAALTLIKHFERRDRLAQPLEFEKTGQLSDSKQPLPPR